MTERTWLYLPGLLEVGADAAAMAVPYSRLRTGGALVIAASNGIVPTSDLKLKLTLDDVAQAEEYTLPAGRKYQEFTVTDGLTIAAGVVPGVIITDGGGAAYLRVDLVDESTTSNDTETGWIILTAAMLQARISAPEYNRLTDSVISSGQSDPIPQLLSDVTERLRLAIRSGGNTLGAVNTIPASLRRAALAIAKHDLFSRISVLRTIAEGAKTDADKAERMIERVEEGKLKVEAPADGDETETGHEAAYGGEDQLDL